MGRIARRPRPDNQVWAGPSRGRRSVVELRVLQQETTIGQHVDAGQILGLCGDQLGHTEEDP